MILKPGVLIHQRRLLGFARSHRYEIEKVRDLRVVSKEQLFFDRHRSEGYTPWGGGAIAFDYGSKTVRFGDAIGESEADAIVRRMVGRYGLTGAAV